jgi:type I restriction enzyme R subunit
MPTDPLTECDRQPPKRQINGRLAELGWTVAPFPPGVPQSGYADHALAEYETAMSPEGYALSADGQLLGIVEGKKVSFGPQNVLAQVERFFKGVADSPFDFRGYRMPFLYSTNRAVDWFHDIRFPLVRSRRVTLVHTPAALGECRSPIPSLLSSEHLLPSPLPSAPSKTLLSHNDE